MKTKEERTALREEYEKDSKEDILSKKSENEKKNKSSTTESNPKSTQTILKKNLRRNNMRIAVNEAINC